MLEAMPWLTVTKVAQQTGLSAHTLRYYERVGLLGPVARGEDGRRRYAEADLAWLAFLVRLRTTGMAIRDMQRFAALRREGDATIGSRRELLEHHRDDVLARIAELRADLRAITNKIIHHERLEPQHEHSDQPAMSASSAAPGAWPRSTAAPERTSSVRSVTSGATSSSSPSATSTRATA